VFCHCQTGQLDELALALSSSLLFVTIAKSVRPLREFVLRVGNILAKLSCYIALFRVSGDHSEAIIAHGCIY